MFYLTNFKNKFLQTQKYILCRIYMYGEGLVHFPKYALLSRTWRQMDSNAQASNHSSVPALGHQASNKWHTESFSLKKHLCHAQTHPTQGHGTWAACVAVRVGPEPAHDLPFPETTCRWPMALDVGWTLWESWCRWPGEGYAGPMVISWVHKLHVYLLNLIRSFCLR